MPFLLAMPTILSVTLLMVAWNSVGVLPKSLSVTNWDGGICHEPTNERSPACNATSAIASGRDCEHLPRGLPVAKKSIPVVALITGEPHTLPPKQLPGMSLNVC